MAETLPQNIPIPTSAAVASFNFFDIAEGTGIIEFHGAVHSESNTPGYYLTTTSPYSNQVIVSGAVVPANTTTLISNNSFLVKFNRAQNLKGNAKLNICFGGRRDTGSGSENQMYLSGATIKNATTGQTLATSTSDTLMSGSSGVINTFSKIMNIDFDLTGGPYHFAAGDTLSLNLPLWGVGGTAAAIIYGGYGADPIGRTDTVGLTLSGSNSTSKMTLYLPFLNNQ